MSIGLRELMRRPGKFIPVGVAMVLLVVLLVVLGGFLDGLSRSQTGVLRAQGERRLVFSTDAELSPTRSRVGEEALAQLAEVDGVDQVGALSQVATTATFDGEITDVIVVGYELATDSVPAPSGGGQAVMDSALADLLGVAEGDTVEVGPARTPLQASDVVGDLSAGAPTMWVPITEWATIAAAADPTGDPAPQIAVLDSSRTTEQLQAEVAGLDGLEVASVETAIAGNEVVTQQSSTFQGIIAVTLIVTLLVVALFFVLLTIERAALYAVLKAVGGRTSDLLAGLAVQAVIIAVVAVVIGVALSLAFLALVPADLPVVILPGRVALLSVATVGTAVLGALATLRRILRIDPAEAIG